MPNHFNRNIYGEVMMEGKVMSDFQNLCIFRTFERNAVITAYDSFENYLNIIHEGQAALFFRPENKPELCFDINYAGEYISSYGSYISQTPSIFEMRAITEVTLISMSYENMYTQMYKTVPNGSNAGREAVETVLSYTQDRMVDHYTLSATERYLRLVEKSNGMILQTPAKIIASYLGIQPQTLSKIRNQMMV